jgi:hypothetical protein
MDSARVVADHAADSAVLVRRRIGSERQSIMGRRSAQRIERRAWLDARAPTIGIDFEDAVHVFRKVEYDARVAALAGQTRPAASTENRRTVGAARFERVHHIFRRLAE